MQEHDVPLHDLVSRKYEAGIAAQKLSFSPTELAIIHTASSLPFQLRYCPSLNKKPVQKRAASNEPVEKKVDPFADPDPDLLIDKIPRGAPSHFLVLNKYPIIKNHFILATVIDKPQTYLLELDDLLQTYKLLRSWSSEGRRLYAFFNSGPFSGASQPHRHLQFLPVESMDGDDSQLAWAPLIDSIIASPVEKAGKLAHAARFKVLPSLPCSHFGLPISEDCSFGNIYHVYRRLINHCGDQVQSPETTNSPSSFDGPVPFSYNLGMVEGGMVICPRSNEGAPTLDANGTVAGTACFNGTLLAGTLMVKNQEEWDALKRNPTQMDDILYSIGVPSTSS
ncbi:Ap4A phosphorylase-like protein II [Eremomyces bilateralis CBS 781.70]|uniref:Ap4A phosphorylase-like protein II n=1 Tax=Eremomyces bilateralis CBS 781.70 TaxID=1392243 RepID=A0A6G1GAF8_9PEZI|nr:Ap4A phosphorylase-like protein II [Eremomyces bilateralis CBS 781.70]KAF1814992.1 Ap4A phosphorylase-like protein II [Eremomyces bilateralis CBS 781.70]